MKILDHKIWCSLVGAFVNKPCEACNCDFSRRMKEKNREVKVAQE